MTGGKYVMLDKHLDNLISHIQELANLASTQSAYVRYWWFHRGKAKGIRTTIPGASFASCINI